MSHVSLEVNSAVPAFHVSVPEPKHSSKILLSFDPDDCFNALYRVIADYINATKEAMDFNIRSIAKRSYLPYFDKRQLYTAYVKKLRSDEEFRIKMNIKAFVKIEELDEELQDSVHAFANKVSCFTDVEFWTKPTSWLSWLYRKIWGEGKYDHKISICSAEIENSEISNYVYSVLEKSGDVLKYSNVVLFHKFDPEDMKFSDVIHSYHWIPHNVFGHALGLKHPTKAPDIIDQSDIRYQSYMNNSVTEETLADCVALAFNRTQDDNLQLFDVLKHCGIVSEMTPVDLKGLQNIWGGRNVVRDTVCYQEIEGFQQKYPDFINIINVDI